MVAELLPSGVVTIGIDPTIELGPVTLAWHGLTIAIGVLVGAWFAARAARERGLATDPLYAIGVIVAVAGLVGGKAFFLLERGRLGDLSAWFDTQGFTFNGGLIAAAVGIALFLRRTGTDRRYLDVVAVAFPLGVAVGRIGDVINGEHYGPPSGWLLAVRNTHPDASVPDPAVAYHSGGLYEVLLGLAVFAIVWPLRRRFVRPMTAVWTVLALFAVGRFFEFFFREDSEGAALGLTGAQWTSVGLLAVVVVVVAAGRRDEATGRGPQNARSRSGGRRAARRYSG